MKNLILLSSILLLFSACQETKPTVVRGEAQGTTYTIKYFGDKTDYKSQFDSILKVIDLSMSNWVPTSAISRFNQGEDSVLIDWHFMRNLRLSMVLNNETDGAFNPLVKPLIDYYGFGADALKPEFIDSSVVDSIVMSMRMDSIQLLYGNRLLDIRSTSLISSIPKEIRLIQGKVPFRLDFNAIAQGYSVDVLAEFLKAKGVESFLIELGGEMRIGKDKPNGNQWRIAVDKPVETTEHIKQAEISISDQGIATSGNYRKYHDIQGEKFHHTLDPITGYPAKHNLLSATVIAENAAIADAFATSFMVMGLEKSKAYLEKHPEVKVLLVYSNQDGGLEYFISDQLEAEQEGN